MKYVFRVDASSKMGSGHVIRCLTLAEILKKNNNEVIFLSRLHDGNLNDLIYSKGFNLHELSKPEKNIKSKVKNHIDSYSDWLGVSIQDDLSESINIIKNKRIDWIIIDHYSIDIFWEKKIKEFVKNIMIIDDIANREHDCDLLLDQNFFIDMNSRYDKLIPPKTKTLFGPKYSLISPKFSELRKKSIRANNLKNIFIFFGGSDPYLLTEKTLEVLSKNNLLFLKLHVAITDSNKRKSEIKKAVEKRGNASLHIQSDQIASIMNLCDASIGAGGMNTWERLCLSLPSIAFSFSNNQKIQLESLSNSHELYYAGDARDISYKIIDRKITNFILKLKNNIRSNTFTPNLFEIVDGEGSKKVAKFLT